jgi:hypothetical protein
MGNTGRNGETDQLGVEFGEAGLALAVEDEEGVYHGGRAVCYNRVDIAFV